IAVSPELNASRYARAHFPAGVFGKAMLLPAEAACFGAAAAATAEPTRQIATGNAFALMTAPSRKMQIGRQGGQSIPDSYYERSSRAELSRDDLEFDPESNRIVVAMPRRRPPLPDRNAAPAAG